MALSWTAATDLRAEVVPSLIGTDDSLSRGAVVSAAVSPHVADELWRHTAFGGYYTRLDTDLGLYLEALGVRGPSVDHGEFSRPSRPLASVPTFDFSFRGRRGFVRRLGGLFSAGGVERLPFHTSPRVEPPFVER